jgi:hypothetical protein
LKPNQRFVCFSFCHFQTSGGRGALLFFARGAGGNNVRVFVVTCHETLSSMAMAACSQNWPLLSPHVMPLREKSVVMCVV